VVQVEWGIARPDPFYVSCAVTALIQVRRGTGLSAVGRSRLDEPQLLVQASHHEVLPLGMCHWSTGPNVGKVHAPSIPDARSKISIVPPGPDHASSGCWAYASADGQDCFVETRGDAPGTEEAA